jgi:DNA-binding CsgD family transcriptional regulator
MLSRIDQGDLLLPLHEGVHEEPRWQTFLARLRSRTAADHAGLILHRESGSEHAATGFIAVRGRAEAADGFPARLSGFDSAPYTELRPGRVYRAEELLAPGERRAGFARFVRVAGPLGTGALLTIGHARTDFPAADSALLSGLAPHLAIALRTLAELELAGRRRAIGAGALSRQGLGWLALDREGRLIDGDPLALRRLQQVSAGAPRIGARVPLTSLAAARDLADACTTFANDPQASPRLILLSGDPRLELFAAPAHDRPPIAVPVPALIGFVSDGRPLGADAEAMLAAAYGLTTSEARLALALCRGRSLTEAAADLHLTIETARNYSKKVFAKTGTRGQADLVRKLLTSVIALA